MPQAKPADKTLVAKENHRLEELVARLGATYPDLRFSYSDHFRWSPEDNVIYLNPKSKTVVWSLLHEVGHMLCGHMNYQSDVGLLRMEVAAWQKARELSVEYAVKIDEKHVEKCLDSYREWMYRRSSCPLCTQAGIEQEPGIYTCINCQKRWQVTPARFCRVYRKTVTD